MEQEQDIIEGNKLIAEFDGWIYSKSGRTVRKNNYSSPYRIKDIKYHSSWDWLMPVVEKIGEIQNQADIELSVELNKFDKGVTIFSVSIFAPISIVYDCVIEFIKWYLNQNK